MERREYDTNVVVNGQGLKKAVIDPHYEKKHAEAISDEVILKLVGLLSGHFYEPEEVDGRYSYFVTDGMVLEGKKYKLIWLLEAGELYIGIINAYRRR